METPLPAELVELGAELKDLPMLAALMPSSWELRSAMEGVDVNDVMEKLAFLLQGEVGHEEGFGELVKEGFTIRNDAAVPTSNPGKKKKRKKAKTRKMNSEVTEKGDQNNIFEMLA